MTEDPTDRKSRNRFILKFAVAGALAYPVLMFVIFLVTKLTGSELGLNDSSSLSVVYRTSAFLLSPGAIFMMDAEHLKQIVIGLPLVTLVNALWYAFVGFLLCGFYVRS
jgi:hypothetical protein